MSSTLWKDKNGRLHNVQSATEQAALLVKFAHETGANLLALDIEGIGGRFMAPANAERAGNYIEANTRQRHYPLFYANKSAVGEYAKLFDVSSLLS